ncbi:MAG: FAD-dependent oxidoreductase [Deltaproteobacteria bacterium]|nr:FAD-dependent oxidoreductase [Deltaproteobacteria bacterium]
MIGNGQRGILIVGAGSAGLAAAVQAAETGGKVTVVEMHDKPGGVSRHSTGLIRGSGTFLQKHLGIKDSWRDDALEMMEQARFTNDPALIARLAENSGRTVDWLRGLGVVFKERIIDMPRIHLILPDGRGLIDVLYKAAEQQGVEFLFGARAVGIILEKNNVAGVEVVRDGKRIEFKADAVVLCTGGVWQGRLLKKYAEDLKDLIVSYGHPAGGFGDGIQIGKRIGANVVDLDRIIPNVATFLDGKLQPAPLGASSSLRHGGGAIFLNRALDRFVNEDLFYVDFAHQVVEELRRRREKWVWEIWDENARELVPRVDEYIKLGYVEKQVLILTKSLKELAQAMGVDAQKLENSVGKYNSYFESGIRVDPECGRPLDDLRPLNKPPFYAVRVGVECLSTRGGLKVDTEARVLHKRGSPIPNLFAAGDDTGGMHGEGYMTGVSLERAVVYGRIAGDNAATGKLGASIKLSSEA